ncbi:MAG: oligosaccharide flippase family protein [Phormidesmis sp.]
MSEPSDRSSARRGKARKSQSSLGEQSLKARVVKGGVYLTLRQLVSVGLSVVSVLVIARQLGTENYGILVNALGIFYFVTWTGKLGLHAYLVQQQDLPEDAPEQVLAFFNVLSLGFAIALFFGAPGIGLWTGEPAVADLVRWLPLPIATEMIASVSVSMLERNLAFAEVGFIEIFAQLANYLVAIPLVLLGWSYWGPMAGLCVRGIVTLAIAQYLFRVGWRWSWRWDFLRPALRYGLTFSLSHWVMALRSLTLPVLVTPIAGAETAGLVSIAIRLVEQLSTLRLVIRRMAMSVMAKLTDNAAAVRSTISRGMAYQALLVGVLCSVFACLDSWIVPILFGDEWIQSTHIFPLIALATMGRSMFDLHSGALYAVNRNAEVTKAYLLYIVLLWVGCAVLMPSLGRSGHALWGYGLAELLTIFSNVVLHRALAKIYGQPRYTTALWLTLAAMMPILGSLLSPIVGSVAFALSYSLVWLVPSVRAVPRDLISTFRQRRSAKAAASETVSDSVADSSAPDSEPPESDSPDSDPKAADLTSTPP